MFIHPDFENWGRKEYDSVLDFLKTERIISFTVEEDKILISEECDEYFYAHFTKEMMEQFILELQELTNQLK